MPRQLTTLSFLVLLLIAMPGATFGQDDPNLVALWTFDEGSGNAVLDSSGFGNHGTLFDNVTWAPGMYGAALQLDGDAGHVEVPFSDSLALLNQGDFTIAAWMRLNEVPLPTNRIVLQQGDLNGTGRTLLFVYTDNEVRTYAGGAPTGAGVGVEAGVWIHAAVVVTEQGVTDLIQMYVNGEPAGVPNDQLGMEDSQGTYFIGSHKNLNNVWDGLIDDLRIYNRALSAEEIRAMVPPQVKAREPDPADGDVTVVMPLFKWSAGDTAMLHDVYLGTDPNLGPDDLVQSRMPVMLYYHAPGLIPGTTYYWRVDEIEADMTTVHTGDVWTFVAMPSMAYLPDPADGSNEASPDPNMTLTWWAGKDAIEHHVYFSDSLAAVNDGTAAADKGAQQETTFTPGPLDPLASYFWRVDELAANGTVETGSVWTFTTFRPEENFEGYTDEEGSRIYEAWADGWVNDTGSLVGYLEAPFAEQTIVHSGTQSMPLDYNNVNAPHYSEASLTWGSPRDWTAGGADTLVLYVSGNWQNGAEPLYVGVEDTGSRIAVVVHPEPMVATNPQWQRWAIPLSEFSAAGVNLRTVETIYIGLGDRDAPKAGGAGLLFIDDIRLIVAGSTTE